MPNWVENELEVTGPPGKLLEFKEKARGKPHGYGEDGEVKALCEDNFIPYPERFRELDRVTHGYEQAHPDDWQGRPKDGFNQGGYEWCCENWGTKWGFCHVELAEEAPGRLFYTFDTAWSPPEPLIRRMGTMFPELTFELTYYEAGMGFQGSLVIENGESVDEKQETYSGDRGG